MLTNHAEVYAIGECALTSQGHYSLVEAVHEQADVVAAQLMGLPGQFSHPVCGTHLKVEGLEVFMIGDTSRMHSQDCVIEDRQNGLYRRLFFSEDCLAGSVLYGDTSGARKISNYLGQPLDPQTKEQLVFGLAA